MRKIIAAVVLAAALILPAAVASSGDSCPDPAEFTARYGFTPQEYVNRVAIGELTLAAEKASIAAVAAGSQTIDRWSPEYGMQMGLPVLQYTDLYFQARMVEFRDGVISFESALSYLGPTSIQLIGCGVVNGETVRSSLQGIEAAVIAPPVEVPVVRVPSPDMVGKIATLRRYIANLSRVRHPSPEQAEHLLIYRARLVDFLAR